MLEKKDVQSIRNIGKEEESRAQAAGKVCLVFALVMSIPLIILMTTHIINYEDSRLMYLLGLDESPFFAFIVGVTFAVLPCAILVFLGRLISGIGSHISCQSEMAAQASLALLEKFEKEEQLQSDNNIAKAPAIHLDNSASDAGQLPQTWWHCTVCDKVNEPYCNICSKCGNVFGAKK